MTNGEKLRVAAEEIAGIEDVNERADRIEALVRDTVEDAIDWARNDTLAALFGGLMGEDEPEAVAA